MIDNGWIEECKELKQNGIFPKLAVIMVGNDSASKVYVRNKSIACEEVGIEYEEYLQDNNNCIIAPRVSACLCGRFAQRACREGYGAVCCGAFQQRRV